jgi:dihydrofolate reductase
MISIIVAASTNLVIGKGNDLPWHIPSDLKRFKELTTGKRVIMGRNTWESLPDKFRPLPNRENIVLTRDKTYKAEGAVVFNDIESIKKSYDLLPIKFDMIEHFVIGGAEIYKEFLPISQRLYFTEVLTEIEGDTYLKGFNPEDWWLINMTEVLEENGFRFIFKEYVKKVS